MQPPHHNQPPQAVSIRVDVPPLSSWQQVEEFLADAPPIPPVTPELKPVFRQGLEAFRRDVAHLPLPMPERVAAFLVALERAAS